MRDFIHTLKSVILSTLSNDTTPFGSYAPFVYDQHRYYVFISDIATHAQNIMHMPKAGLLFIEDEKSAANIFARKRISMQCEVHKISRDDALFQRVMVRFEEKFDTGMMEMLRNMQDFNLYECLPKSGEATFGFGEAYTLGGEYCEELIPRRGGGHQTKKA